MSILPPFASSIDAKKRVIQIRIKAPVASGKSIVSSIIATALQEFGFDVALDDPDAVEFNHDGTRARQLAYQLAQRKIMIVIVEDSQ
ncbi:hypothetical protein RBA41_31165 [Massilia sp. CCM 9210]|uniref:hypothetical protein n=1 Tax=Massilia scottii TaxID=3057166 RepID=UPI002796613E|nr:hypothetical protein [Massilia sp. CCM 9210]MDQ1817770.1 hypothetical protein [Massilia sp. CCM 9210]